MSRFLGFVALLQAGGAIIFLNSFRSHAETARPSIRRLAFHSALLGIVTTLVVLVLEPARMAGAWSGMWNAEYLQLVLNSNLGAARTVRLLGMALIVWGMTAQGGRGETRALIGATIAFLSFGLIGHVSSDETKWLLYPLFIIHLVIVAFWFGSLLPLLNVLSAEEPRKAAETVDEFSRVAVWLVPILFLAGTAIAYVLIGNVSTLFGTRYGWLVLTKAAIFALLMALAGLNKLRFGPELTRGDVAAVQALRWSIRLEFALIVIILAVTAVMTSFFSPTA